MDAELRTQLTFHVLGKRPAGMLDPVEGQDLRPAAVAPYRDLARLRYDFPLVLTQGADGVWVRSLTGIVDAILQNIAPRGAEGEKIRRQVLRLEQEIRRGCAAGASGALTAVWNTAVSALMARTKEDLTDSFARARAVLEVDGDLVDCDASMPKRLFIHAWRIAQEKKLASLGDKVERLARKLADVLAADFMRSESGRTPAALAASVGSVFEEVFDFTAMSSILGSGAGKGPVSDQRRRRIERSLKVLQAQPYLTALRRRDRSAEATALRGFVFDDCKAALAAFRAQLPAIVDLVKAIAVAELEIEGRYIEAEHDPFFAAFDEAALGANDLALMPSLLVCVGAGDGRADQRSDVMSILSSGLPIKVLVQTDDILGDPLAGDGAFTLAGARLATMAVGLNDAYVLQASAANLFGLRERIAGGLAYAGPALFSVFSGASKGTGGLPPYLAAAAATQSRTFPAFSYDPSAGPDLASRFSLEENPQPEADWPTQDVLYENEAHQRVTENLAFTFADFVACDPRYARHFARVPRKHWNGTMMPVDQWLGGDNGVDGNTVPYVLMVERNDTLQRSIADEPVIAAARRCRDMWHRLQELGGIHNSYAERLLVREKQSWEEQRQRDVAAAKAEAAKTQPASAPTLVPAAPASAPATASVAEAPVEEKKSDDPYIETLRCTSCNECTNLNNRMFQYNENKQAFVADPSAGTYRQLVEAAESCQVSIIHPGKPRDPNEPDVAELIKRAEPFL